MPIIDLSEYNIDLSGIEEDGYWSPTSYREKYAQIVSLLSPPHANSSVGGACEQMRVGGSKSNKKERSAKVGMRSRPNKIAPKCVSGFVPSKEEL